MVLLRHISVALSAAAVALGSAIFIALNLFYPRRRRIWTPDAHYSAIKEDTDDPGKRQVLVLGLDGAGKSSVLQGLTPGGGKKGLCRPTRGFNFMSFTVPAYQLDFLEIGGGEELRLYWVEYLMKTHVLVYVVDSSDRDRLPVAKLELHRLLGARPQLPVVVLANKQDKAEAVSVSELYRALSLASVAEDRKLFLLAAQLPSDGTLRNSCQGLDRFQDFLLQLV